MDQAEFNDLILVLTVGFTALGGVIFAALLRRGWRNYALAVFLGLVCALIVEPSVGRHIADSTPLRAYGFSLAVSVGGMIMALMIAEGLLDERWAISTSMREGAPRHLIPENWQNMGRPPAGVRDRVKRWFTAISAATGAVVGGVFGIDGFAATVSERLSSQLAADARNIVLAVLPIGIVFFLAEPLQAYVFDIGTKADEKSEPSQRFSAMFEQGFDWRVAGRLGVVLLVLVQIGVVMGSLDTAIREGNPELLYTMIAAATTPAIVTYYWSAALQRRAPSIREAVTEPSLYAGAVMNYGVALMLVLGFAYGQYDPDAPGSENRHVGMMMLLSPVIAIGPALVISAVATAVYAVAGGYAMDRMPGRYAIFPVMAALLAAAAAHQAASAVYMWLNDIDVTKVGYATFIGSILGWIAGLWVSGFARQLATESETRVASTHTRGA